MEYRPVDVTIIAAKGLKSVNFFSKMDVYAVVAVDGDPRSKQRTPVDRDGGKAPTWNFPVKFSLDDAALQHNRLTLHVRIRSRRLLGDRDVGDVYVPLKELLDSHSIADMAPHFVSYQVRRPSGKPKGVLHLSYKFGEKIAAPVDAAPAFAAGRPDQPVTAYPPPPAGVGVYSYGGPPPPGYSYGYGYPPPGGGYQAPPPPSRGNFGMGLGAGLLGGALGGLLIGDMMSDSAAYDDGYGGGF